MSTHVNVKGRSPIMRYSTARLTLWAFVLTAILCVVLGGHAFAQGFGRISGTVTDPSGAVIPGAVVTAVQAGTGAKAEVKSNDQGGYTFPSLAPSTYNLSVAAPGFSGASLKDILLQADAAVTQNVTLKIGDTSQTVTVSSDAMQVDTTTSTLA